MSNCVIFDELYYLYRHYKEWDFAIDVAERVIKLYPGVDNKWYNRLSHAKKQKADKYIEYQNICCVFCIMWWFCIVLWFFLNKL